METWNLRVETHTTKRVSPNDGWVVMGRDHSCSLTLSLWSIILRPLPLLPTERPIYTYIGWTCVEFVWWTAWQCKNVTQDSLILWLIALPCGALKRGHIIQVCESWLQWRRWCRSYLSVSDVAFSHSYYRTYVAYACWGYSDGNRNIKTE